MAVLLSIDFLLAHGNSWQDISFKDGALFIVYKRQAGILYPLANGQLLLLSLGNRSMEGACWMIPIQIKNNALTQWFQSIPRGFPGKRYFIDGNEADILYAIALADIHSFVRAWENKNSPLTLP